MRTIKMSWCLFGAGLCDSAWNMLQFAWSIFDKVMILSKSPARLSPCQSVIHNLKVWSCQKMYDWINRGMLTFRESDYLIFAVPPPWSDDENFSDINLRVCIAPGSSLYRFISLFILSFLTCRGEEDKMVAGGDENKSHPSLFIRHEKDTQ